MKRLFAAVTAVMLLACGCTEITYKEPEAEEAIVTAEPEPPSYPVAAGGLIFNSSPERVAALSPAVTEIIYEMGFGSRVVCRGEYCDYPEEAAGVPSAGSGANPDIDGIIALSPEVVITQNPLANTDMAKLRSAGIETLILPTPVNSDELYGLYSTLACIFAGETEGAVISEKCLSGLKASVSYARGSCDSLVFIMEVTNNGFLAATGDSFAGDFTACFGRNIAADGKKYRLSSEELISADPQVIFLAAPLTADSIDSDIADELSAFENGYVYVIDGSLTERPTSRLDGIIRSIAGTVRSDTGGAAPAGGFAVIETVSADDTDNGDESEDETEEENS